MLRECEVPARGGAVRDVSACDTYRRAAERAALTAAVRSAMEWSWPLFVRITRYDLGWSKAYGGWHERLHPEQPKSAVVSVVAAAVVSKASADGDVPGVARVAAKATPVGVKATPVAVISAPVVRPAPPSVSVAVAAVVPAPAPMAGGAPKVVAVATPAAAVATAHAKGTSPSLMKPSSGLGLPQFLVMLEVPGGQVCQRSQF